MLHPLIANHYWQAQRSLALGYVLWSKSSSAMKHAGHAGWRMLHKEATWQWTQFALPPDENGVRWVSCSQFEIFGTLEWSFPWSFILYSEAYGHMKQIWFGCTNDNLGQIFLLTKFKMAAIQKIQLARTRWIIDIEICFWCQIIHFQGWGILCNIKKHH